MTTFGNIGAVDVLEIPNAPAPAIVDSITDVVAPSGDIFEIFKINGSNWIKRGDLAKALGYAASSGGSGFVGQAINACGGQLLESVTPNGRRVSVLSADKVPNVLRGFLEVTAALKKTSAWKASGARKKAERLIDFFEGRTSSHVFNAVVQNGRRVEVAPYGEVGCGEIDGVTVISLKAAYVMLGYAHMALPNQSTVVQNGFNELGVRVYRTPTGVWRVGLEDVKRVAEWIVDVKPFGDGSDAVRDRVLESATALLKNWDAVAGAIRAGASASVIEAAAVDEPVKEKAAAVDDDLSAVADKVAVLIGEGIPRDVAIRAAIKLRSRETGSDLSALTKFVEAVFK